MAGKRKAPTKRNASAQGATRKTTMKQQAAPVAAVATEAPERGMSDVDEMLVQLGAQVVTEEDQGGEGAADIAAAFPEIDPLATYWTELDLFCKDCNITHYVNFCTLLNADESPHLVERARVNQHNYKRCPLCHKIEYVQHPWTFYDPQRKLVVQVRPEWEWHAGGGEEWYAARLEDLFDKWSEHDVRLDVAFGPEQFIERYLKDEKESSEPDGEAGGETEAASEG